MTNLLSTTECRILVTTSKTEEELESLIAMIEKTISNRIGEPQNESGSVTISESVVGGDEHLFVKVPFSEIISITEDGTVVDSDEYRAYGPSGMVERLPEDSDWGDVCVITYKPIDQRTERKLATINLVRLTLERTAMVSENVAGEYSSNAPDWDKAIKRELRNLCLLEV